LASFFACGIMRTVLISEFGAKNVI